MLRLRRDTDVADARLGRRRLAAIGCGVAQLAWLAAEAVRGCGSAAVVAAALRAVCTGGVDPRARWPRLAYPQPAPAVAWARGIVRLPLAGRWWRWCLVRMLGVVLLGLLETLLLGVAGLLLARFPRVVGRCVVSAMPTEQAQRPAEDSGQRAAARAGIGQGTGQGIETVGIHRRAPMT
jgi:hypothetical protein